MTGEPWKDVTAAKLPACHLAALAPLRAEREVHIHAAGEAVWVRWPAALARVVTCLLPVPGVSFFSTRDGNWFRFGHRLPASESPPNDAGQPLASVLVPARFNAVPPPTAPVTPVTLGIVRGGDPEAATALLCEPGALATWVDSATTAEIVAVKAAWWRRLAILQGEKLPTVSGGVRYWGDDLLVPVGFRPDPDLPPVMLRAAIRATADEVAMLDKDGATVIPRDTFAPLSRAGVRLALRGAP
jgi:hypothetical protein